ncbi:MFS transporter [uncultured Martelella sp.]|uniref:MFS transporter n=1 Tax=uncultured Martelella sp. TaxID=392331 RepID=UPI0029C5FF03|nr:MFS transporter [uncultured Martelella sp.]
MTQVKSAGSPGLTLLAIGLGAFAIGTTEFAPMGMLPSIAAGIDVSIPAAGQLVTAYAVGVMISAPFVTLFLARFGQRRALLATMAIYIVGNLLSAIAPEYWSLMAGRIITSLCQGAFFGFGAVAATSVVAPERRASALATMFMGLSIANIGGVPASAWMGETIGWRMAFVVTVILGIIALVALALAIPQGEPGKRPDAKRELAILIRPQVLMTLASTVLFAGGFFAVYTYVTPILQNLAGASGPLVILTLMLIGMGLTFGNWVGGRLADWSLEKGAALALTALALTTLAIPLTTGSTVTVIIGFMAWAIAAFTCTPALQLRAMHAAADAPSLAASMNIAAFNFGNAVGAAVGGAVIGVGFGYAAVPVAASVIVMIGLGALLARHRVMKPA